MSWRRLEPTQVKVEDLPVEELGQAIAEWVPTHHPHPNSRIRRKERVEAQWLTLDEFRRAILIDD
jgi:hypothetical protein